MNEDSAGPGPQSVPEGVVRLASMLRGLDVFWSPESPDARTETIPCPDQLDTIHAVIALRCAFCARMYQGVALEARGVVRARREADPDIIDLSEVSAKYPAALNRYPRISIGIIGGGMVGRAVLDAVLRHVPGAKAADVMISTRQPERMKDIAALGAFVGFNNGKVAEMADVIFLCCPPSAAPAIAAEMSTKLAKTSLVVSVMSGVSVMKVRQLMKSTACARVHIDADAIRNAVIDSSPTPDGFALLRPLGPKVDQFRIELATCDYGEHLEEMGDLSEAIVGSLLGHNLGVAEAEVARAAGSSVEEQRRVAKTICLELFEPYWQHDLIGDDDPSLQNRDLFATWNDLISSKLETVESLVAELGEISP